MCNLTPALCRIWLWHRPLERVPTRGIRRYGKIQVRVQHLRSHPLPQNLDLYEYIFLGANGGISVCALEDCESNAVFGISTFETVRSYLSHFSF